MPGRLQLTRAARSRTNWICASCRHTQSLRSYSVTCRRGESNAESSDALLEQAAEEHHAQSSETVGGPRIRSFRKIKSSHEKRVLSMIQPTGIPHLGNYFGALQRWKAYQDEVEFNQGTHQQLDLSFAIADLHSLTGDMTPAERRDSIKKTLASLLAIGLDKKYSTIFCQSQVHGHADLMWVLSSIAPMGHLHRMTQWKTKSKMDEGKNWDDLTEKQQSALKLGLFSYPVLQAADILIYRPHKVPVGEDQKQHIEFTRSLARTFNHRFCEAGREIFPMPELVQTEAKRVMSLTKPTEKMSKSKAKDDPKSVILITDHPDDIRAKFKRAETDSIEGGLTYDPQTRPGIANLFQILKHSTGTEMSCEELAKENENLTKKAFKDLVSTSVIECLAGIRERYEHFTSKAATAELAEVLAVGTRSAQATATDTMNKVRNAVGLTEPTLDLRVDGRARWVHQSHYALPKMTARDKAQETFRRKTQGRLVLSASQQLERRRWNAESMKVNEVIDEVGRVDSPYIETGPEAREGGSNSNPV